MTLSFSRSIRRAFFAEPASEPVSCGNSMPFEVPSNDSSYYGEEKIMRFCTDAIMKSPSLDRDMSW